MISSADCLMIASAFASDSVLNDCQLWMYSHCACVIPLAVDRAKLRSAGNYEENGQGSKQWANSYAQIASSEAETKCSAELDVREMLNLLPHSFKANRIQSTDQASDRESPLLGGGKKSSGKKSSGKGTWEERKDKKDKKDKKDDSSGAEMS